MNQVKYLIVGASHAGLEAINAIRMVDQKSTITLVSRDTQPPYSPTILPYIVSGQSTPEKIALRSDDYFKQNKIRLINNSQLLAIDKQTKTVSLSSGDQWQYEKLLLATGADAVIPPIAGVHDVPFHVLRSMDDAIALRAATVKARTAVVLGAGLIGMHAAENLQHAGIAVTMVEMHDQVLPGYFDSQAANLITDEFNQNGICTQMGGKVVKVNAENMGCRVFLENEETILTDLLLIATGVKPNFNYLRNTDIETDTGILVDDHMQTSASDIWAAGDVAQARDFYSTQKVMTSILPDAVLQGRTAAQSMCEDNMQKPYMGGIPINTYTFFGKHAISVGNSNANTEDDMETFTRHDTNKKSYLKIVLKNNHLYGISSINEEIDSGIMWQLIRRKVDLKMVKNAFIKNPPDTGRALMSSIWR